MSHITLITGSTLAVPNTLLTTWPNCWSRKVTKPILSTKPISPN